MSKCIDCGARFVGIPENPPAADHRCKSCEIAELRKTNARLAASLAWKTGVPPHSQPGTNSDFFLAYTIDNDRVPVVLCYIHQERQWTMGGGDTQKVVKWKEIEPVPSTALHTLLAPTLLDLDAIADGCVRSSARAKAAAARLRTVMGEEGTK